ncbi:DUF4269 domain-containing protein [Leptospira kirschneri]
MRLLNNEGGKTESAFAHLLGIKEDPYCILFDLNVFSEED